MTKKSGSLSTSSSKSLVKKLSQIRKRVAETEELVIELEELVSGGSGGSGSPILADAGQRTKKKGRNK